MKPSIYTLWPLHISLALLLLNDHILKYQYPGWLGGKASDLAGIFLIVLVLRELFHAKAALVYVGVVAVFTWWKSPFSQYVIDFLNECTPLTVTRTVDYTDLLAFFMIPVAHYVYENRSSFSIKNKLSQFIRIPIMAISMFAIMGTSVMMPHHNYQIRKEHTGQTIDISKAIEIIKKEVAPYDIKCVECSPSEKEGFFESDEIELRYSVLENNRGIEFDIRGDPGGVLLGGGSWDEMEAIQRNLKYSFGYEFAEMEFVVRLGNR
jgi:hypothetical protein